MRRKLSRTALALVAFGIGCAGASTSPASPRAKTAAAKSAPGKPVSTSARASWQFMVSGDSRNCGDAVMPAIAAQASAARVDFYWHLGDFRALYDFDQDFLSQPDRRGKHVSITDYNRGVWDDFIQAQIVPFGSTPVFLGIGNHELVVPKTRLDYVSQFADWINAAPVREQRLKDDPKDHRLKTWYHWIHGGVDFVTLDNASNEQFDSEQLRWFDGVIGRAEADPQVTAIVVGMHAALPDSLAFDHSMNDWAQGEKSGRTAYARLVQAQKKKPVYILASHSHFYMSGLFDTPEKKAAGEAIPGWIIGTAGAVRYKLPPGAAQAKEAKTNVYGYLIATVEARGAIRFDFKEVSESDLPAETVRRMSPEFVHECFAGNSQAR
ncbi:MAG: metallophosphoesterase [Acidobacteriota bacterium]